MAADTNMLAMPHPPDFGSVYHTRCLSLRYECTKGDEKNGYKKNSIVNREFCAGRQRATLLATDPLTCREAEYAVETLGSWMLQWQEAT